MKPDRVQLYASSFLSKAEVVRNITRLHICANVPADANASVVDLPPAASKRTPPDLIAASISTKYPVGPSIRPICSHVPPHQRECGRQRQRLSRRPAPRGVRIGGAYSPDPESSECTP